MSPHVLSNRRGDLYLAGLRPIYALSAISDNLPLHAASAEEVRRRVRSRFPGASPLPGDAELHELIQHKMGRGRASVHTPAMAERDGPQH